MREYRGMGIGSKKWFYGSHVQVGERHFIVNPEAGFAHCDVCSSASFAGFVEVIPSTIGQQVDLPDKNDAKMYKGDKIEYCGHKLYEVVWDSCAYYKLREINPDIPEWKRDCIDFVSTARGELEIIGNIHQEQA